MKPTPELLSFVASSTLEIVYLVFRSAYDDVPAREAEVAKLYLLVQVILEKLLKPYL